MYRRKKCTDLDHCEIYNFPFFLKRYNKDFEVYRKILVLIFDKLRKKQFADDES